MELDAVRNGHAVPYAFTIGRGCRRALRPGRERGREGRGRAALECVAALPGEFELDLLEGLPFALPILMKSSCNK